MKLFVDSANLDEIEALTPLGIVDGVTTNPSLLAKVGDDPRAVLKRICDLVHGPVSAEVVATAYDGMVSEGRELAAIVAGNSRLAHAQAVLRAVEVYRTEIPQELRQSAEIVIVNG